MFERLKKLALTPVWPRSKAPEPPPAPAPPAPILAAKGITCSKCRQKALTFVTVTNGARYCVKCWSLIAARRPVS